VDRWTEPRIRAQSIQQFPNIRHPDTGSRKHPLCFVLAHESKEYDSLCRNSAIRKLISTQPTATNIQTIDCRKRMEPTNSAIFVRPQVATCTAVDGQTTLAARQLIYRVEHQSLMPKQPAHLPQLPVLSGSGGSQEVTIGTDAQGWPVFIVSEGNIHDGSKIIGGPIQDVRIRYTLMVSYNLWRQVKL
jgi:hypothetical protein